LIQRVLAYPENAPQRLRVYAQDMALMPGEAKILSLEGVSRDSVLRLESQDLPPYILGLRWRITDFGDFGEF